MVIWFYYIVFFLSLLMTGSFLYRNPKTDTTFILFSILVTINCLGNCARASAQTLEMAVWANKFLYVGGVFAPLLLMYIIARLCGIRIPRLLGWFMAVYSAVVLGLVLTVGYNDLYYKEVSLAHGDGYSYLVKDYGPLHILYPVLMLLYCAIFVFFVIYTIRHRQRISVHAVAATCIAGLSVIVLYIAEKIFSTNISLHTIGYFFAISIMILHFERLNKYDMSANIASSVEKMKEYGYLVFDEKLKFVNANEYIKEVFPEINDWKVDTAVEPSDSYLYCEVIRFLLGWDGKEKNGKKTIHAGERYFELNIRTISYGRNENAGYLLEFIDRTLEQKYYNTIQDYNASLEKQVAEKTENILHIKDMMVLGMADMVESRDNNTGGHIKRTSAVIRVFSKRLSGFCGHNGIDEMLLRRIEKAAPMHDLGKISIADSVLKKTGRYTDEEYNEMKRHSAEGARIVENILRGVEDDEFVEIAKNVAHYHHEKWNGQGYPCGLAGTDIPVEARIMALADVFDALVSKRCYKEAFSYDKAFSIIEESLGEHFDPELGKVFLECREDLEALYNNME